ncbi:MAG TPA: GNAT family N-acetyltransferase [Candidatus Avipropionibacterium avicola]|uniref:GNAT family N-acetyltransferase n=1 Tax=Candidatus Avipropionibacterium avicola TaxID=2840701 RepID=A0A9D1KN61_9ACTN|nr:GNAT family N-acetyltransferase [Candidatus Avipropionibacterium avicola]
MAAGTSARLAVRALGNDDLTPVVRLLVQRPVSNLFVSARIRHLGLDPFVLGCQVLGCERDGELVAMCHAGSNLVPVGSAAPDVLDAFAERIGPTRRCSSISGEAAAALGLWERLTARWQGSWTRPRDVRRHQPLMAISADPALPGDTRVEVIGPDRQEPYFEAAVAMYTEEVGVSPLAPSPTAYRSYVETLLATRRAFGVVQDGRVVFKADLGAVSGEYAQIQGVWLAPHLRGQGLAAPMMASMVTLARRVAPHLSLYVNDYNLAAIRTYERVGFTRVGEFATVLY